MAHVVIGLIGVIITIGIAYWIVRFLVGIFRAVHAVFKDDPAAIFPVSALALMFVLGIRDCSQQQEKAQQAALPPAYSTWTTPGGGGGSGGNVWNSHGGFGGATVGGVGRGTVEHGGNYGVYGMPREVAPSLPSTTATPATPSRPGSGVAVAIGPGTPHSPAIVTRDGVVVQPAVQPATTAPSVAVARPASDVAATEQMPLNPTILGIGAPTPVQEWVPSLTPIRE